LPAAKSRVTADVNPLNPHFYFRTSLLTSAATAAPEFFFFAKNCFTSLAVGPTGFAAHANGRKRFMPVSRTKGSQRDELKSMRQK